MELSLWVDTDDYTKNILGKNIETYEMLLCFLCVIVLKSEIIVKTKIIKYLLLICQVIFPILSKYSLTSKFFSAWWK